MDKPPLLVQGMLGFGDCIHQRALLRQLMTRYRVILETSAPCLVHDLIVEGLTVVEPESSRADRLRTQAKNRRRERSRYSPRPKVRPTKVMQVWYRPDDVRELGSVFAAMCVSTGCDPATADFRLPVPQRWRLDAMARLAEKGWNGHDPVLMVRPLVERPSDWTGCGARNPDFDAYHSLYIALRDLPFFVVSVADLEHKREWQVGHAYAADATFHHGELDLEMLVGLSSFAALAYGSPGFIVPMRQAVGMPIACVCGGYESSRSFSFGARFAPYLGIDPISPCECFQHKHGCSKTINLAVAKARLIEFAHVAIASYSKAA